MTGAWVRMVCSMKRAAGFAARLPCGAAIQPKEHSAWHIALRAQRYVSGCRDCLIVSAA